MNKKYKKKYSAAFIGMIASLMTVSLGAQETTAEAVDDVQSAIAEETTELASSPVQPLSSPVQSNEEGVAIDGFDPVAYFDESKAVKGVSIHSCEYLNRTWHFSSEENRDKFLADPEKFAPQYGGYCAHSLSNNKIIESDPESFAIRDDKLYLYVNDRLAEKDINRSETKFDFNRTQRDRNWFTYQQDF